jgi:hypothetical protein
VESEIYPCQSFAKIITIWWILCPVGRDPPPLWIETLSAVGYADAA